MIDKITTILKTIGVTTLNALISLGSKVMDFLTVKQNRKIQKETEEKIQKENSELKDICDNGSLSDLLNRLIIISSAVYCTGCIFNKTNQPEVNVLTTNQWEGHYMTVEDFYNGTKDIELKKDESIWVISNTTLYHLLQKKDESK